MSRRGARLPAAAGAYPQWRRRLAGERAAILRRWYDLILEHQDEIALIMTSEQGKPLAEARGEVMYAASFLLWFAEEARRVYGDIVPSPWPNRRLVGNQGAGRRGCRNHALELSGRDDHAQGRASAGRRLHRGRQAGEPDTVHGARCFGLWANRRACRRAR